MDKYERRDEDYETDNPDGSYWVSHIVYDDKKDQKKFKRIIHIKNGLVHIGNHIFTQLFFFEVNKIIDIRS